MNVQKIHSEEFICNECEPEATQSEGEVRNSWKIRESGGAADQQR